MNKQELYRRTIDKFGEINQIKKVDEELRELRDELWFWNYGDGKAPENIFSEIADVRIMLEQLELILLSYDEQASSKIAEQKDFKLKRLSKLVNEK